MRRSQSIALTLGFIWLFAECVKTADIELQPLPEQHETGRKAHKICKETLSDCDPSKQSCLLETPCDHGTCDEMGQCVCEPCWDGDSCDDLLNFWAPSFDQAEAAIVVPDPWNNSPIYTVTASDRDLDAVCAGAHIAACTCAQVSYAIISGNQKEVFSLDESTGYLHIIDPSSFLKRGIFHLEIGAWSKLTADDETDPESVMRLRVASEKAQASIRHPLNTVSESHRGKREVQLSQDELVPEEDSENYKTDFQLALKSGDPAAMEIGKVLKFEVVVSVPPTERLDLQLDIFTKDVVADAYTSVLGIFNIETTVPPEMTLSSGEPQVSKVLSSQQGSNMYDRILINFGDLINPDTFRKIVVTFSVTAVRATANSKVHHVTVGAEYDFERFIWISQTEVTLQKVKPNEDEKIVEVDFDGPKEIAMDSAEIYTLDAYIKIRSDEVSIKVTGPTALEDVLSVGNLGVSGFGKNFMSVPQNVDHYRTRRIQSATKESFKSASIDIGTLTNTGSVYQKPRTANNENKVSFTIGLFALTRPDTIGNEEQFSVAIEVAGEVLWQDTFRVNLTERNDNETLKNIEDSRVANAPQRALLGHLLQFEVYLNLTSSAFTEIYLIQSLEPDNPVTLCSARFDAIKSGFNVIWANTTGAKATNDGESVTIDMGRVYVSGQRNASESIALLHVFFFVDPEVSDAPRGEANPAPVKLKIGKRQEPMIVPIEPLIIEPKRHINPPEVRTADAVTWREIYMGGAVAFDIIVTFPLNAFYTNLSLSVTDLSNISLPGAHICRASVSHIGRGLPCAQPQRDYLNENAITKIKVQSKRQDEDSVFVQFDRLCHVGTAADNQTESQIIINVVANLQGEQSFTNGEPFPLHTVLSLNNKAFFQDDRKFIMARPPSKDFLKNQAAFVYFTNVSPAFNPGGVDEVEIVVKTPPKSMALYLVELSTNDPDVSVCILKIKSIGDSMPCAEESTPAEYVLHSDPDNGNKKAALALNALANVGTYPMKPGRFLDPNSLVFSAIVKIRAEGRSKYLKLKVSYGSKGQIEDTIILPVSPTPNDSGLAATNEAYVPLRTLQLAPSEAALTSISPGSITMVTLTIELVEFASTKVRFDLTLDDGVVRSTDLEVCHEGISHLGKNYPCSSPGQWSKQGGGENVLGQYNIGSFCNSFTERSKQEENYVRFTVPVLLKPGAKYAEGTAFSISSQLVTGAGKDHKSLQLIVGEKAEQTLGKFFEPSVKPTSGGEESIGIRQRIWIPFNITVPKGAMTEVSVKVQGSKTNKVTIVVLHDLRITAVGRNIPCYKAEKLHVTLASSFNNVQNDKASARLGYFANPCYSHVRGRYQQGDDDIVLEALVEMTDHEAAHDGSKHPVTINVAMTGWEGSSHQNLVVVRTGKEATAIDVKLTVNSQKPFERGAEIPVMAELKHFASSFLEPTRVALRVFLPNFVTFGGLTDVYSGSKYKPEIQNASNGVNIVFPKLLFADEIRMNMTLLSDPENRRGYGTGLIEATSPYRVECEYTARNDRSPEPFCSEQHALSYKLNSDECILNLGLEDGTIKDCQITASSATDLQHAPSKVRKGSSSAWSPAIKEGMDDPHLDIAFLRVTRVSQLEVIYVPGTRSVRKYRLQASNDARNWWNHLNTRTLSYENGVAKDRLPLAVQARHLRILIVEAADEHVKDNLNIGMQLELYGCYIGSTSEHEGCVKDTTWYTNVDAMKTRHVTVDTVTDTAYFCDYSDSSGKNCLSSSDGGVTWKLLPTFIGRLIGFDKTKRVVFAQDKTTNGSYFATENGIHWMSVNENEINLSTLANGVVVPAKGRNYFVGKQEFNVGKWKATFDGMFFNDGETPVVRWSSCCAPRGGLTTLPFAT